MVTFVFVPGCWHGGWYFQSLAGAQWARRHRAYSITLTGLGEPEIDTRFTARFGVQSTLERMHNRADRAVAPLNTMRLARNLRYVP
jgi:hypothetical protein